MGSRRRGRSEGPILASDTVAAFGIEQVLSAPRSPWQRAYVERVIGTIRRECLDVLGFGPDSLHRHLRAFVACYNYASQCPTFLWRTQNNSESA